MTVIAIKKFQLQSPPVAPLSLSKAKGNSHFTFSLQIYWPNGSHLFIWLDTYNGGDTDGLQLKTSSFGTNSR